MAGGSRTRSRTSKAEQAAATRGKVIDAATELFLRDGFVTTTMAAIAREAGVVVQTLYLGFGSKTAILQAAFDRALRGDAEADVTDQEWFAQVLVETDGRSALRLMCHGSAEVIGRAAPLFDVMRAAAADPEVGEMLAHNKQLRYTGYRRILDEVSTLAGFNPDLTLEDALGVVYTVLSEDAYLLMVTEHGSTPERWLDWVVETCCDQLFPTATELT